jgi:outer membrane receptor protein involved in Fe transport
MRHFVASFAGSVLFMGTLCAPPLLAQSVDTGILGVVRDSSGGVIPGATVAVTNKSTSVVTTVVSGVDGAFEIRYMGPGEHGIDVSLQGFRTQRTTILLRVAQMMRLDFTLQLGEVAETITVVAKGQLLETQSAVVRDVVTEDRIESLPVAGRNFVSLGNLTPGVVASNGEFKAGGMRSRYQQITFDGVSVTNNRNNVLMMFPSLDVIEEINVQTSNYTAEYGGHAGASVHVQLKAGSSTFKGSLSNYMRDGDLNARNFFSPLSSPKPELKRNQFGGVLSGPIARGRTFFMAGFEGIRETRETVTQTNFLTAAMRQGDFTGQGTIRDPVTGQPFPGSIIPTDRLDPRAVAIINKYQPLPNTTGANNAIGTTLNNNPQDQFMTRIDHNFSDKHRIFGHYLLQDLRARTVPINPNFSRENPFRNQTVAGQFMTIFRDNVLNEVRYGYSRGNSNNLSSLQNSDFSPLKDLGISNWYIGGPAGRPQTSFEAGFPAIDIQGFGGLGYNGDLDLSQTNQFVDNLTWIRGSHGLKAGLDLRYMAGDASTVNQSYGRLVFTRDVTGNAAAAFMMSYPRTAQSPEGLPVSHVRQWRSGLYLQDDWKVNTRLTLNLGLRYDFNQVQRDTECKVRTLRFDLNPGGPVLWPAAGECADPMYFNDHLHWAPRFGSAYRMGDHMVFRGGYGVFVMAYHLNHLNTLHLNPPNASVQLTNPSTPIMTIANPFPAALLPTVLFNVTSTEVDRHHPDGYYQNWNTSAGYEFSARDMVEVRYVGARGTGLDTSLVNWNSPDPDPTATDIQSRRPYPQFAKIRMWAHDGSSTYRSLQTQYRRSVSAGQSITVAYTWGQNRDNQAEGLNNTRARRQNPRGGTDTEWANSTLDIRHRLVVGWVWEVPFASKLGGVAGFFLKRWQLSGVGTIQSGSPIFITQDGDALNTDPTTDSADYMEIRPNLVPGQTPNLPTSDRTFARWFNTAAFSRTTVTYGNSPRNPVVGPGRTMLDVSVAKSFRIPNGQQIQFKVEAFDALNTPLWGNPNGILGNSSFGRITTATNREMQIGLRYTF